MLQTTYLSGTSPYPPFSYKCSVGIFANYKHKNSFFGLFFIENYTIVSSVPCSPPPKKKSEIELPERTIAFFSGMTSAGQLASLRACKL
jgi:hypothetical protein